MRIIKGLNAIAYSTAASRSPDAGNSHLVFMVSAAFAAPLMPFANAESGGFNFVGTSSSGKTTGALVATSVMSNRRYMQNWRATSNGLEAIAAQYNHALLPLDEIEIATSLLVTGWNKGEAFDAAKKCFDAWLAHRGGSAAGDISNGINQVRHFLELHGASRFYEMSVLEGNDRTVQRCGFKERPGGANSTAAFDYYILPEAFKNEVCKGYDATVIAKALEKRDILIRDGTSLQARKYISGMGKRIRVYHITAKIFEDEPPSE